MASKKILKLEISPRCQRQMKKLSPQQLESLKPFLKVLAQDPMIGVQKSGDLSRYRVYKFKLGKQLFLLAYYLSENVVHVVFLGSHENFYRDLKKHIK